MHTIPLIVLSLDTILLHVSYLLIIRSVRILTTVSRSVHTAWRTLAFPHGWLDSSLDTFCLNFQKGRFAFQKYDCFPLLSLFGRRSNPFVLFQKLNLCAWLILSIGMPAIVFSGYESNQIVPNANRLQHALFSTLGHIVWSLAVCYIIFACVHDSGGPINTFLSLRMWQPLSKLSYAIFLCHCTVISIILFSTKIPMYYNEFTVLQHFISFFVLTTFVAILLALAIEMPIDAMSKLNLPKKNEKIVTHFWMTGNVQ